jgi:hypothetical protein
VEEGGPEGAGGTFEQAAPLGRADRARGPRLPSKRSSRPANLTGKTVIDATNPIADAPPVNGVLRFLHQPGRVADGALQSARRAFRETFSCVGNRS